MTAEALWLSCSISISLPSDPSHSIYPDGPFWMISLPAQKASATSHYLQDANLKHLLSQDSTSFKISNSNLSRIIYLSTPLFLCHFKGFRFTLMPGMSLLLSPAGCNEKYQLSRKMKGMRKWGMQIDSWGKSSPGGVQGTCKNPVMGVCFLCVWGPTRRLRWLEHHSERRLENYMREAWEEAGKRWWEFILGLWVGWEPLRGWRGFE